MKRTMTIIAAAALLSGCLGNGQDLKTDMSRYQRFTGMSCSELSAERDRLDAELGSARFADGAKAVGWSAASLGAALLTAPALGVGGLVVAGVAGVVDEDQSAQVRRKRDDVDLIHTLRCGPVVDVAVK